MRRFQLVLFLLAALSVPSLTAAKPVTTAWPLSLAGWVCLKLLSLKAGQETFRKAGIPQVDAAQGSQAARSFWKVLVDITFANRAFQRQAVGTW